MNTIHALRADVAKSPSVHNSVVTLVNGIAAEILTACEQPRGRATNPATAHTAYDRVPVATTRPGIIGAKPIPVTPVVSADPANQYREGFVNSARVLGLVDWLRKNAEGLASDVEERFAANRP